jgi:hypothetical protein
MSNKQGLVVERRAMESIEPDSWDVLGHEILRYTVSRSAGHKTESIVSLRVGKGASEATLSYIVGSTVFGDGDDWSVQFAFLEWKDDANTHVAVAVRQLGDEWSICPTIVVYETPIPIGTRLPDELDVRHELVHEAMRWLAS